MTDMLQDNTGDAVTEKKSQPVLLSARTLTLVLIAIAAWVAVGWLLKKHPLEGKPAPSFSGIMLDGSVFDMADHLGKRPIFLDFWAVWCPPCRNALPKVAAAAAAYSEKDIVICAVNLREAPDTISSFLRGRSIEVPVLLDADGAIADKYGVTAIPLMVFIDRTGKVRKVQVGAMSEGELTKALEQIL